MFTYFTHVAFNAFHTNSKLMTQLMDLFMLLSVKTPLKRGGSGAHKGKLREGGVCPHPPAPPM